MANLCCAIGASTHSASPVPLAPVQNLWSPSFIFLMAGTGFLCLSLTYVIVDVKRWWTGRPFVYVGMNRWGTTTGI